MQKNVRQNRMRQHLRLRELMGSQLNIFEVQYEQIKDNSMHVIRQIYQHAGRELTAQREQPMHRWEGSQPQREGGKPSYRLEDDGIPIRILMPFFMDTYSVSAAEPT